MSEDVYNIPDLAANVRYGRRETEQEMEKRGEKEERIVDIYVSADNLDPDPGTHRDSVQQNTAHEQHAGSEKLKKNLYKAVAVCLGLLCVILFAGIIGLVIYNFEWTEEKNNLVKELQSRCNAITAELDELKKRLCELHGFTFAGGVCYYISTESKTWNVSKQYCRDNQSELMIINSKEKQDFVNTVVKRNQWVWLGLTDEVEEGTFKWVDGTPLTTPTYWQLGRPNNFGEQDCVVFLNERWDDISCLLNVSLICERVI